jgi:hypothetical protein
VPLVGVSQAARLASGNVTRGERPSRDPKWSVPERCAT